MESILWSGVSTLAGGNAGPLHGALPGAGFPYRVGTGTSVRAPSMTACCSRTKAMKGLSRKSTSPTSTLEASASRGSFFMNLFFSCSSERGRKRKLNCVEHVLLVSAPLCRNCACSRTLQCGTPGLDPATEKSHQRGMGKHCHSSHWVLKLSLCSNFSSGRINLELKAFENPALSWFPICPLSLGDLWRCSVCAWRGVNGEGGCTARSTSERGALNWAVNP